MKRIVSLLLISIMVLSIIACGDKGKIESTEAKPKDESIIGGIEYPSNEIVEIDINSDGEKESIQMLIKGEEVILKVNDQSIEIGFAPFLRNNSFKLVDLDTEDNLYEIIIEDLGPSDDPTTTLYYYDGEKINKVATVEGFIDGDMDRSNVYISGDGTLTAPMRLSILQTWFTEVSYKLNENHQLEMLFQQWYLTNHKVTTTETCDLFTSPNVDSDVITVDSDQELIFTKTDNEKWIEVKLSDGRIGWLYIDQSIDYMSKFNGLALYD